MAIDVHTYAVVWRMSPNLNPPVTIIGSDDMSLSVGRRAGTIPLVVPRE